MMNPRRMMTRSLVLLLSLSLSGCFFKVGSLFHYDYPIQKDGVVDLSLAPLEDFENFTVTGYYPPDFGLIDVEMQCLNILQIGPGYQPHPVGKEIAANSDTVFVIGLDPTLTKNLLIQSDCAGVLVDDGSGRYGKQITFRAGDVFLPIITEDNMTCIVEKVMGEGKHYLRATEECFALDSRATTHPLGLNSAKGLDFPQEINILTVIPPA